MKHLAVASITLFLIFGAYSATPVLNVSNATSLYSSQGPWLFPGAYQNYTISGNVSFCGNSDVITGYFNSTILRFDSSNNSIEANVKLCEAGMSTGNILYNCTVYYSTTSFLALNTVVNESILSQINNGNMGFFCHIQNASNTDTTNVVLNTKFGSLQSDLINYEDCNGKQIYYIDSQNGIILNRTNTIGPTYYNGHRTIIRTYTIDSTNVPMSQKAAPYPVLALSVGVIYEIAEISAVILVVGAAIGYVRKRTKS